MLHEGRLPLHSRDIIRKEVKYRVKWCTTRKDFLNPRLGLVGGA